MPLTMYVQASLNSGITHQTSANNKNLYRESDAVDPEGHYRPCPPPSPCYCWYSTPAVLSHDETLSAHCSSYIEMSGDIKEQVVAAIKESGKFSLQLDESTDVSDDAQLLVYVRYQGKSDIEENFLFCKRLETTTTGEDLFKLVDNFIKEEGLKWDQCYSVCSDGAPAMLGARQGFTARVKQVNPTVIVTHCLLHRENLASRKMSLELNTVIEDVIQIVNFVKSSALNSRLFNEEDASLLDVQSVILGHLEKLIEEFDKYIPDGELHEKYKWLCRPFDVQAEDLSEEESSIQNLQEELIEVQHDDETLRFNFERQTLDEAERASHPSSAKHSHSSYIVSFLFSQRLGYKGAFGPLPNMPKTLLNFRGRDCHVEKDGPEEEEEEKEEEEVKKDELSE
ncbi:zinc finger MYM-type protein 6-like [Macrobrachium rosenbergii]|uniref:zinc finger MYM-type protein 6-like n=1 Tax=Macrobrachium rosenbergii TaxID=79674 RepID=UPI0034D4AB11